MGDDILGEELHRKLRERGWPEVQIAGGGGNGERGEERKRRAKKKGVG
jgi:hypothetical protein